MLFQRLTKIQVNLLTCPSGRCARCARQEERTLGGKCVVGRPAGGGGGGGLSRGRFSALGSAVSLRQGSGAVGAAAKAARARSRVCPPAGEASSLVSVRVQCMACDWAWRKNSARSPQGPSSNCCSTFCSWPQCCCSRGSASSTRRPWPPPIGRWPPSGPSSAAISSLTTAGWRASRPPKTPTTLTTTTTSRPRCRRCYPRWCSGGRPGTLPSASVHQVGIDFSAAFQEYLHIL